MYVWESTLNIERSDQCRSRTQSYNIHVVSGMCLTILILEGYVRTFGLVYLEFIDLFGEGPEKTGLVFTIYGITGAVAGEM